MPNFPGNVYSKLPQIGITIFTKMSALAQQFGAVNLSQGFPDFNVSPKLIELVTQNMIKGNNQYVHMAGLPLLREVLCDKIESDYSIQYNYETEITITAGATQAIFTAIAAFVKEGDEVIVLEPAYDCYVPAIELCGGICKHINLNDKDFSINWLELKKVINQKTKMIIINSPHNPTSSTITAEDLLKLQNILKGTDIILLSDEVYENIIFDGLEHQSVCRFPELASRSLVVFSFGKTYHATGWKLGYIVAPQELMKEFRKIHQYNVFCVNAPMQYAFAEFIKQSDEHKSLKFFYQEKRDFFLKLLKGSKFIPRHCSGSYFQILDYTKLSEKKDTDYAIELTQKNGVASIPLSNFYAHPPDQKLLRFCFAKENETLEKAAELLHKA
jgi:methionine aminotransferase